MTTTPTTYSSKSTAVRGARRAGLQDENYIVSQQADGRWVVLEMNRDEEEEVADEPVVIEEAKDALAAKVEEFAPIGVATDKLPAYKVLARQSVDKSTIENPVEFVHEFCNQNPDMKRKMAVASLVGFGINYSTARTQYQKWFSARK